MSILDALPPSLNLPPHLSAHKYFFVCTLTVAAWDTLVLSPRTWRLLRTKEWPILKILFHFMRVFMPIEFIIVAVAFFDTKFTSSQCDHFYLFEPICTAILLACASVVHIIRISAIWNNAPSIKFPLYALLAAQIIATAVVCGFQRPMPLIFPGPPSNSGQGCIAGPKFEDRTWTGIYWLFPTVIYAASFVLALMRSMQSLQQKKISYWKLMLRDGLNLYGAILIVNLTNLLFYFIATPTDTKDTIKTIVTSMAAVLTTTMTLRIILSIRGPLAWGGTFNGSQSSTAASHSGTHSLSHSRGVPPHISNRSVPGGVVALNPNGNQVGMGVADDKERRGWDENASDHGVQYGGYKEDGTGTIGGAGVKVTIDRTVDDGYGRGM